MSNLEPAVNQYPCIFPRWRPEPGGEVGGLGLDEVVQSAPSLSAIVQ